jgi:hypothetical protein
VLPSTEQIILRTATSIGFAPVPSLDGSLSDQSWRDYVRVIWHNLPRGFEPTREELATHLTRLVNEGDLTLPLPGPDNWIWA